MNKTIIVTGASRGIGKAIAILLAKNGSRVVVNYAHNTTEAKKVVSEIKEFNGEAIEVKADVSNKNDVIRLFETTIAKFGKVDVLINNAGIMTTKSLAKFSTEEFQLLFDVNVKGIFNTMQQASEKLADNGIIINFSSTTVKLMLPGYSIYSATKAAIEQMSRVFSKEIGRGISVNCIAPGPTKTDLFLDGKSEEKIEKLKNMNAFNRLAEPKDIAKIVLFLASDDSKWITGQTINANGGMI